MPGGDKKGGGLVTKRSALYQKSGGQAGEGSPIPQVLPILKAIGTKIMKNKVNTAIVTGATHQLATDKRDMSFGEKALRTIDDWTTGGLGQMFYDSRHNEAGRQQLHEWKKKAAQSTTPPYGTKY